MEIDAVTHRNFRYDWCAKIKNGVHTSDKLTLKKRTHQIPNVVETAENPHFSSVSWSVGRFVCVCLSVWMFPYQGKWVFAISESTCAASRWQSDAVSSVTRPSPPPLPWLCMCPSQLSSQVLLLLLLRTQALCENHLCVRVRVCDRVWLLGYNNQVGPCRRAQASNIYTDFSLTDVHSACPLTLLSLVCVLLKKPIL